MNDKVGHEKVVPPLSPRGANPRAQPLLEGYHQPVLLKEVLEFLQVAPGKRYIDATLGLGGHAAAVVRAGGLVLGIEVDRGSLAVVKNILAAGLKSQKPKVKIIGGNFKDIGRLARENGFTGVDGVLFDLGMSSWQLEQSGRGFSFQKNEPLDMRMDANLKVTAADLVNGLYEKELGRLFRKFGEDPRAFRYARALVAQRQRELIRTTKQLADLIADLSGHPSTGGWRHHPATRVFQALRIAVNSELENLAAALPQARELIKPGGRLVVISFHSLEDRIVKRFFTNDHELVRMRMLTVKPVTPGEEELAVNPRARSAKLRVVEIS